MAVWTGNFLQPQAIVQHVVQNASTGFARAGVAGSGCGSERAATALLQRHEIAQHAWRNAGNYSARVGAAAA